MCRFNPLPGATNNIRGAQTVRIATSEVQMKGFTVALCASTAGEKLPAYIIFKERGGKLGPRVKAALTFPENVKVSASANGWMIRMDKRGLEGVWWEEAFGPWQLRTVLIWEQTQYHWLKAWTPTFVMFLEAAQVSPSQWMCPSTLLLRRLFRSSGSSGEEPQLQGNQTGEWRFQPGSLSSTGCPRHGSPSAQRRSQSPFWCVEYLLERSRWVRRSFHLRRNPEGSRGRRRWSWSGGCWRSLDDDVNDLDPFSDSDD